MFTAFISMWLWLLPMIGPAAIDRPPVREIVIAELLGSGKPSVERLGEPKLVGSPYGEAVYFDGTDDGIVLHENVVGGLSEFTVEMLIRFEDGGGLEQRFFHAGSVNGNRTLLEARCDSTGWYADAYLNAGQDNITLVDPKHIHPFDTWYRLTFSVKNRKQIFYVDGIPELVGTIPFTPISGTETSIGVRQNRVSWFRGAIYSIRIYDKAMGQ